MTSTQPSVAAGLPGLASAATAPVQLVTAAPAHVYVIDTQLARVFEFPIVNGIAAGKADRQLRITVPAGDSIGNMAIDGAGYLYVVGYGKNSQVAVYAPGASRSDAPIRVLKLPIGLAGVTVDRPGNVYYVSNPNGLYAVYPAGASGDAAPIHGFTSTQNSLYSMSVVGSMLYATSLNANYAFSNAITAPAIVRQYCLSGHQHRDRFTIAAAQTVDPVSHRFFVDVGAHVKSGIGAYVAIYASDKSDCPGKPGQIGVSPTSSGQSFSPGVMQFFGTNSLAVFDGNSNVAYQIAAAPGMQTPVATMKAGFKSVSSIAVGP